LEVLVSDFKKLETKKVEYHLNNIFNSSKHANDLLENLLTWARIQRKAIHYNPKKFNVHPVITDSLELLEGAYTKKNIKVEVITAPDIILFADKNMFSTIIRNLVFNAIKFTQENGNITISTNKKKNCYEIAIKDNGVGIPQENISKIFRVNSNLSTSGTNGEKGTGLGLIVVKDFIEKHNGEIWVESQVGKGSKFTFTLPLKDLV
jgi:signal transduction histidine kinase